MRAGLTDEERRLLLRIQDRLLWLTTNTIHHANSRRANPSSERVGGHQSSSTSVLTLLTALYFKILRPGDRIAVKPTAAPVFYAIQVLRGLLAQRARLPLMAQAILLRPCTRLRTSPRRTRRRCKRLRSSTPTFLISRRGNGW